VGGGVPGGWDIWTQLYNHYVVVKSKIYVYVRPKYNNNNYQYPVNVGIFEDDDATIPVAHTSNMLLESGKGVFRMLMSHPQSTGASPCRMSLTYNPHKTYGIKDISDNIGRLGAPVTALPADQTYWFVWAQQPQSNPIIGDMNLDFTVVVDYYILFTERKSLDI